MIMSKKAERNYARFYALLRKMPGADPELKEMLIEAYTNGRTKSLRDMTEREYNTLCADLQTKVYDSMSEEEFRKKIKAKRSAVLIRLQKLGIDTSNWSQVDRFCMDPKIAGKRFAALTLQDLTDVIPRLEAILLKPKPEKLLCDLPNYMLN